MFALKSSIALKDLLPFSAEDAGGSNSLPFEGLKSFAVFCAVFVHFGVAHQFSAEDICV